MAERVRHENGFRFQNAGSSGLGLEALLVFFKFHVYQRIYSGYNGEVKLNFLTSTATSSQLLMRHGLMTVGQYCTSLDVTNLVIAV